MNLHFYHCDVCGKIITVISETKVPTYCCGMPMKEMEPNRTDGAFEKHVPVWKKDGNSVHVSVGSDPHPMLKEHSICWIGLRTSQGFQIIELKPEDLPEACFYLCSKDCAEAAYAFCNLHGLWCAQIQM